MTRIQRLDDEIEQCITKAVRAGQNILYWTRINDELISKIKRLEKLKKIAIKAERERQRLRKRRRSWFYLPGMLNTVNGRVVKQNEIIKKAG